MAVFFRLCYNLVGDNMAIDGYFVNKLVNEISLLVTNARVEKVHQIRKDIFVFNLYLKGGKYNLYFKLNAPNAAFFLGEKKVASSLEQSGFLLTLKRLFEGNILSSIKQHQNDRVVIFTFDSIDFIEGKEQKQLILELMGRHNNLIITKNNIIIDAYSKNFFESSRSILPKLEFSFFPNSKRVLDESDFPNNVITPNYYSQNYMGISPLLSNYMFEENIKTLNIALNPTYDVISKKYYWFDLFKSSSNKNHYPSLSDLLEDITMVSNYSFERHMNFVNSNITHLQTKLEKLKSSYEENLLLLHNKELGDYIYSSQYNLNSYYSEITTYDNKIIALNPLLSLNENAQKFYKTYQKAKRGLVHLEREIANTSSLLSLYRDLSFELTIENQDIKELESVLFELGFKSSRNKPNNKKTLLIPLKITIGENIIYVGKNNQQNEYITHTLGKPNDYWFHVKDAPGSHVILKGELNDETLSTCAMLAAKFSSLKDLVTIPINYTKIKNIKKIPGIPGYQVILKEYQTLNIKVDNYLIDNLTLHSS